MNTFTRRASSILSAGLLVGFTGAALQGCDDSPLGDIAEQCGLVCPAEGEGIVAGNASISGVASVDAFFGAVVNVDVAASNLEASVRAELEAMAAAFEIDAEGMATADLIAEIKGELNASISANVEGSVSVQYTPPKCEASLSVAAEATAKCEAEVDPGSVEVSCEGSCQIDASAQAECSASGSLTCTGTAPNFQCEGSCSGSCKLEAAASCEGTCNGTCEGTCSNENGDGSCAGSCDGMCTGTCELSAGGSCSGSCEGSCEYTPPEGVMCEAGASAECDVSADVDVECSGSCSGEVQPPEVSAECEASVKAEAKASMECKPPALELTYQFAAGVDAQAQAEFRALMKGQIQAFARIAALADPVNGKGAFVLEAAVDLIAAAETAVRGSIEAAVDGELDFAATFGLGCALGELSAVGTIMSDAQGSVQASFSAFTEIGGEFGM